MTDQLLDTQLRGMFGDLPGSAPAAVVDRAIEEARGMAQRRPRFSRFDPRAWPPQARSVADPNARRTARAVLVLALVALVAAAIVGVGSRLLADRSDVRATLTSAGALSSVLRGPVLTVLGDGRLLVLGQGGQYGGVALLFDPATGKSSGALSFGPPFATAPAAQGLRDGRVLLLGDLAEGPGGRGPTALGWLDVSSGKVTVAAEMLTSRFAPAFALLPDGRVLVSGGLAGGDTPSPEILASVEVFDPRTATFSALAPLPEARLRHSMLVLDDGKVLIVGGAGPTGSGPMSDVLDVDLYDPATGQSTVVGTIGAGRGLAAGPPLPLADGRVLIPGGPIREGACLDVDARQAMYRFDPATRQLTPLAPLPHAVEQAVALPDGRVLVFGTHGAVPGGCTSGAQPIQSRWLGVYDPGSGVTAETTDPTTGIGSLQLQVDHAYASGGLLPDGRVALIADDADSRANPVDLFRLSN